MYTLVLAAALSTGGVVPQCVGSCGGCSGSGYDCGGCYGNYGCWGCSGCSGCHGTCGGCGGCFGYTYGCHGRHGGCAGGMHGAPVVPEKKPKEPGKGIEKDKAKETDTSGESARALLAVAVPADARLYINGQLMRTASALRRFDTPPLEKGRAYSYTLRTEVVRGGRTVSETRRVEVRAGAVTNAFMAPARGVAAARR